MKYFIVLTGHAGGSQRMALQDAGEGLLIAEYSDINIAVVTQYDLAHNEGRGIIETEGDAHAGEIETSRILHSHPELVKEKGERKFQAFPRTYW